MLHATPTPPICSSIVQRLVVVSTISPASMEHTLYLPMTEANRWLLAYFVCVVFYFMSSGPKPSLETQLLDVSRDTGNQAGHALHVHAWWATGIVKASERRAKRAALTQPCMAAILYCACFVSAFNALILFSTKHHAIVWNGICTRTGSGGGGVVLLLKWKTIQNRMCLWGGGMRGGGGLFKHMLNKDLSSLGWKRRNKFQMK